jgi:hypothetical protein
MDESGIDHRAANTEMTYHTLPIGTMRGAIWLSES